MSDMIERMAKAHCDFFGGEGWWDAGLLADTKPKALEAMRVAIAAMQADAAPVAMVRVTNGGYAMSLAQYVAYSLPEGDHQLYAHPPVDDRVSTSSPVADRETGNTSVKDLIADAISDSLGPDWTTFDAAHHVMQRLTDEGLCITQAPARGTDCPASHDGFHHVDTSMESGPNNCFHCERPI